MAAGGENTETGSRVGLVTTGRMGDVKPFYLDLVDAEIEQIKASLETILRSGRLMLGEYTERFEREFAASVGTSDAVAVSSGTAALEILLRIHRAAGRRVAVPTNTNFATVAAILHAGGEPVYLDMTPRTFMPTLEMLQQAHASSPLAGAVWVHIGGVIAPDFADVAAWCRDEGLFLIEDAAHAHGSMMAGTSAGAFADGGAFSFFPTKVMTTMEGGMITTNDAEAAMLARSYRNQGKRGATFGNDHRDLGNSWRINELSAAIGVVQLAKLDAMISRRTEAADAMRLALDEIGVEHVRADHMDRASNYKLIVRCETPDETKASLRESGVICGGGVYETPCHRQPVFESVPVLRGGLPVSEHWCPRHVCPPLTSGMSPEDVRRVVEAMRSCMADAGG